MTEQVSYTQLKGHRGGVRLWIEGSKLSTAGFKREARYNRVINGDEIHLTLATNGEFKVSGRSRNGVDIPIIDMSLGRHKDFPEGTRIRAVFSQGNIHISIHHEDAAQKAREERFVANAAEGQLTEGSACTGGGISTAAVHMAVGDAGFNSRVAWVVDTEIKYLQSAYAQNFAITDETVCFEARLEELEPHLLSPVDIFSFSLPCAGFSRSGTSKHGLSPEEHESGVSLFGLMSMIRAANPAVLFSENVREAQGSPMYILMQQELIRRGYRIVEAVLDNSHTGTFENRQRYWFMAISNGLPAELLADVFKMEPARKFHKLADLLDAEVPDDVWADNQYLKDKQVRDQAAGKGFATRQLLSGSEGKVGTIGRFYHKRRSTEPFVVNAEGKERLLSVAEHARCKSIPEVLVAKCNMTTGHEILGQSVDFEQALQPMYRLMVAVRRWLGMDLAEAV